MAMEPRHQRAAVFDVVLILGTLTLVFVGRSVYEDLLKQQALKHLTAWLGPMAAEVLNRLTEISISVGVAALIVYFLYRYMDRNPPAVLLAQEQLRPKLKCSFSTDDPGCFRPDTTITSIVPQDSADRVKVAVQTLSDWYRVKVETTNGIKVGNGCGCLISISKGDAVIFSGETPLLPFAPGNKPDAIAKTIHPMVPEHFDFLTITEHNQVVVTTHRFEGSSSINWANLFSSPGEYRIEMAVVSDASSSPISVLFQWDMHRRTAKLWQRN